MKSNVQSVPFEFLAPKPKMQHATTKPDEQQSAFSLDALDPLKSQGIKVSKGPKDMRHLFSPLFEFFKVQDKQTGNIFKDLDIVLQQFEDPKAFSRRIFECMFKFAFTLS